MTRYLSKMTTIAIYFLLAFLITTNEASKQYLQQEKHDICNLKKDEIESIMKFLKLREALELRFVSKVLRNSTPEVTEENVKYFKPFLNYGYHKNIGFILSNYCSTLHYDAEELHLINENIHLIKPHIYRNSCVFALNLNSKLMLYGGIAEYEETVPIQFMKGDLKSIDVQKRVIIGIIKAEDGLQKCFTVGDPNFCKTDVPEKIQQEILEADGQDYLYPMCTWHICSVWNLWANKVYSWANVDDTNEILPPKEILEDVVQVKGNHQAICTLFDNGTVAAWGNPMFGGKIPETMKPLLKNTQQITSTEGAFAALLNDGKVFAWGHPNFGGNPSEDIQAQLYNVLWVLRTNDDQHFTVGFTDGRRNIVWP